MDGADALVELEVGDRVDLVREDARRVRRRGGGVAGELSRAGESEGQCAATRGRRRERATHEILDGVEPGALLLLVLVGIELLAVLEVDVGHEVGLLLLGVARALELLEEREERCGRGRSSLSGRHGTERKRGRGTHRRCTRPRQLPRPPCPSPSLPSPRPEAASRACASATRLRGREERAQGGRGSRASCARGRRVSEWSRRSERGGEDALGGADPLMVEDTQADPVRA